MKIVTESDGHILLDDISDDYESGCAVVAAALRVALNRLVDDNRINGGDATLIYEEVLTVVAESRWEDESSLDPQQVEIGQ